MNELIGLPNLNNRYSCEKFVLVIAKFKALSSKYKYKAFQRNGMSNLYSNLQHFIKTEQFLQDFNLGLKLLMLSLSEYL